MHSIRTKITSLTVAAVLISALFIGAASILTVKGLEESSSRQLMNVVCAAECDTINHYLNTIEDEAQTVSNFVCEELDAVALYEGGVIGATGSRRSLSGERRTAEQKENLDRYLRTHLERVREMFSAIVSSNNSVQSYYYRINPELSEEVGGFWYARYENTHFREMELTSIENFTADDFSYVGWYYLPLERGRPSWLDPYRNANLNMELVSYSVPVYQCGTFIGIIGIDISYGTLVEQINALEVMDTGYAFLTDDKGKIICHPLLESGALLGDVNTDLEGVGRSADRSSLLSYTFNGAQKRAAVGTLSNGLRLFVSAPAEEISAGWLDLSRLIVFTALAVLTVFLVLTLSVIRRIIQPLERLARASKQLSAGDYNLDLGEASDDEVGTLTRSFQQMARDLQVFIQDLNSKAYSDALTGVRSRAAFDIFSKKMEEEIHHAQTRPVFAIAMFDCNELKVINDTFGHEKGDLYLQSACQTICKTFVHSPVFRIGGDEFAAVLQREDLRNRLKLEYQMEQRIRATNERAKHRWEQVSLAWGFAEYDLALDRDFESVLRRADARMYAHKKRYKENKRSESLPAGIAQ